MEGNMVRKTSLELTLEAFHRMSSLRGKLLAEGYTPRQLSNKKMIEYLIASEEFECIIRQAIDAGEKREICYS